MSHRKYGRPLASVSRCGAVGARVDTALDQSPKDGRLLVLAGRTYASTGDVSKSEQLFRRAIDAEPNNLSAYTLLGNLYLSQQKLEAALAEFERASARSPESIAASTMVAIILQAMNREDEAKVRYQDVLRKDPNAAIAANNLAWMMAESDENIDLALQLAQTAKTKLPLLPEVSDTLGWIYYKKNMMPQAITALRDSIDRSPKNPLFHYHLGMAYMRNGDRTKAKTTLEEALRLGANFPGAADARKQLSTL